MVKHGECYSSIFKHGIIDIEDERKRSSDNPRKYREFTE